MTDHQHVKGACLCGAVTLEAASLDPHVGACHCRICRTWGGGPLLAVDAGQAVTIVGEDSLTVYDSSAWADRGFCSRCGSHLFYRLKAKGQYIVPAGLFGDIEFDFDHQVFIDEKPSYYEFKNATNNMTGDEVFAYFAASDDQPTQDNS